MAKTPINYEVINLHPKLHVINFRFNTIADMFSYNKSLLQKGFKAVILSDLSKYEYDGSNWIILSNSGGGSTSGQSFTTQQMANINNDHSLLETIAHALATYQLKLSPAQMSILNGGFISDYIKPNKAELDAITTMKQGDLGFVNDGTKLTGYVYNNNAWEMFKDDVGGSVDLSQYATTAQLAALKLDLEQQLIDKNDEVGLFKVEKNVARDQFVAASIPLTSLDSGGQRVDKDIATIEDYELVDSKYVDDFYQRKGNYADQTALEDLETKVDNNKIQIDTLDTDLAKDLNDLEDRITNENNALNASLNASLGNMQNYVNDQDNAIYLNLQGVKDQLNITDSNNANILASLDKELTTAQVTPRATGTVVHTYIIPIPTGITITDTDYIDVQFANHWVGHFPALAAAGSNFSIPMSSSSTFTGVEYQVARTATQITLTIDSTHAATAKRWDGSPILNALLAKNNATAQIDLSKYQTKVYTSIKIGTDLSDIVWNAAGQTQIGGLANGQTFTFAATNTKEEIYQGTLWPTVLKPGSWYIKVDGGILNADAFTSLAAGATIDFTFAEIFKTFKQAVEFLEKNKQDKVIATQVVSRDSGSYDPSVYQYFQPGHIFTFPANLSGSALQNRINSFLNHTGVYPDAGHKYMKTQYGVIDLNILPVMPTVGSTVHYSLLDELKLLRYSIKLAIGEIEKLQNSKQNKAKFLGTVAAAGEAALLTEDNVGSIFEEA